MSSNQPKRKTLCAIAAFLVPHAVFAAPISPNNPPQGRFADDWMEVYLGKDKVGYAHSTLTRSEDIIKTEATFKLELGRAEQAVKIGVVQTTTETIAGVPLEFGSEMDLSTTKTNMKGVVREGKVTITNCQFGLDTTNTYAFPPGGLMSWGLYRESINRGFKPGTEYTLDIYAPDLRLDGPTKATMQIGDMESFDHRGKKKDGQRVVSKMETPIGSMTLVSWVDTDGNPIKSTMPMPGLGDFVLYTCDEAVALAEFAPPEFFMKTVIPISCSLERGAIKQIKYLLKSTNADTSLADFPETDMQKSKRRDDGAIELTVTRQEHKSNPERKSDSSAGKPRPDLAEYLSSNLMINIEDPKLKDLAKQAKGDATDPYVIGDNLRKFVTDYVETKSLNIGFATASEVARTREGDCSEHGILLAALGRLCGLPSRVVVGLAYVPFFGKQDNIFGYHMWAEFYIEGAWVDFDAALRETDCSPARIAFATSSLKDSGLADLSLPLMGKIGTIDLKIVEIDGKPVEPQNAKP